VVHQPRAKAAHLLRKQPQPAFTVKITDRTVLYTAAAAV
jgi:hypothetical protein